MLINNICFIIKKSTILKGFVILLFVPLIYSDIYYNEIEEKVIKSYSTTKPSLQSSNLLMLNINKNSNHRSSSLEQIRYYKSSHQHLIPIKFDDNQKKTAGTLSLLIPSFYNKNNNNDDNNDNNSNNSNNSTTNYESKNIIFQKLERINKILKQTLKQFQETTSKSFINFNYTQIKYLSESYSSSSTSSSTSSSSSSTLNLLLNSKIKSNSQNQNQKNSKCISDSYIPKNSIEYTNNSHKNGNKMNFSLTSTNNNIKRKNDEIIIINKGENVIEKDNNNNNIKKNQKLILQKKSTIGINTNEIHSHSKSTMELNETRIFVKSEDKKIEKENVTETNLEKHDVEEKKETSENEAHSIKKLNFEKSIFAYPEGIALVFFILYATFMF